MSNKGVGIAFKLTTLVLLIGILGVSIGILIVTLNVRDDVETTVPVPTYATQPTSVPITVSSTTISTNPLPPCTTAYIQPKTTLNDEPVDPVDPVDDPKTTTETPVDPVDPVDPVEDPKTTTENPVDPVDPVDDPKTTTEKPVDPVDPVEDPKTTTETPVDPVDPVDDPKTTTEKPEDPVDAKTTTETPVDDPKTTTQEPAEPEEVDKNISEGKIIDRKDARYSQFAKISNLYEKWMDLTKNPCDDFYHYVCGKGQQNKEESPFTISQRRDNQVESEMWKQDYTEAPLPVKQVHWFREKCHEDTSFTIADQEAKIKEFLQQYIDYNKIDVPFFNPGQDFDMDKTTLSKLVGYAKGQFGAYAFLTAFVSNDFKNPDERSLINVDQPLPIFQASTYTTAANKEQAITSVSDSMQEVARILELPALEEVALRQMSEDVVEFDKVIAETMQQDEIVRRQVERNYNPRTLGELNEAADQFDWVEYVNSVTTLVNDKLTVGDDWTVIIFELDITLNLLNDHIKQGKRETIANYVFFRAFDKIMSSVPPPPGSRVKPDPMAEFRAKFSTDKRTLTGALRKPEPLELKFDNTGICGQIIELFLPWAATRMYVDQDHPDVDERKSLKDNVAEIANWIFFGFRSQLDQLNWMDPESKKGAFNKLDNIQLNVAYPDWVTNDAELTAYYKDLDIAEEDNFMSQVLKLTTYFHMQEMLPLVAPVPRDRTDFSSFIGVTNAWYQPQMNSITFPEGILQEPFYSPDYPLATVFGGLGSISGHELTHGFDDQGVQWDGIGALNAWMTDKSQVSFNDMAQCVIDEYSGFCYKNTKACVNGANTQGENIADNGGIQAAYKALKAYESLNGADPRLPGFGSTFTSDQLFFLTFAQTWCDQEQTFLDFVRQTKTDVHSPALYRVLGTIQNFPAFKNAFNCDANTPYTPDKHCNVWTSKPF